MKKINLIYLVGITIFLFQGCTTLKEGFSSQRKQSTDEFLVEKKSPLVMPPDYNELPMPNSAGKDLTNENNNLKTLITKTDQKKSNEKKENKVNRSFKNSILDKIKNN